MEGSGGLRGLIAFSWGDALTTLGILTAASLVCFSLRTVSTTDFHVPLIFVFAVFLVSCRTRGYLFGLLASVISVFGVNFAFTYPYFAFDFSLPGYSLTFLISFAVSVLTGTLTTQVRRSEEFRRSADREAMRANLLRAISHDFRTPLTSIAGSVNVVLEEGERLSAQERATLLRGAKADAEWLINMVENLLSITRMEGGEGAVLHTEPQLVEEVLEESGAKFRRRYPDAALDIRIPREPLLVSMDAVLIEQVLLNLLTNAVIHGQTTTRVTLACRRQENRAVFSVMDDGVGIDRAVLPLLFRQPVGGGVREDSDRNMGIGLTVCGAIVRAHGGTIRAENLAGGGAEVRFSLPLEETEA